MASRSGALHVPFFGGLYFLTGIVELYRGRGTLLHRLHLSLHSGLPWGNIARGQG